MAIDLSPADPIDAELFVLVEVNAGSSLMNDVTDRGETHVIPQSVAIDRLQFLAQRACFGSLCEQINGALGSPFDGFAIDRANVAILGRLTVRAADGMIDEEIRHNLATLLDSAALLEQLGALDLL